MDLFLVLQRIAEERIREAIENGEFDDLELKGKPLDLREDPFVPEELRTVYKILKGAGFLPKEVELRKEIAKLEELLEVEEKEAYLKVKKLNSLILQLNQMRRGPVNLEKSQYYNKIAEKIKLSQVQDKKEPTKEIDWKNLEIKLYISSLKSRKK